MNQTVTRGTFSLMTYYIPPRSQRFNALSGEIERRAPTRRKGNNMWNQRKFVNTFDYAQPRNTALVCSSCQPTMRKTPTSWMHVEMAVKSSRNIPRTAGRCLPLAEDDSSEPLAKRDLLHHQWHVYQPKGPKDQTSSFGTLDGVLGILCCTHISICLPDKVLTDHSIDTPLGTMTPAVSSTAPVSKRILYPQILQL